MKVFTVITLLIFSLSLYAQKREITGKVISASDRTPMPGVAILEKFTSHGLTTNAEGEFRISLPLKPTILVISFLGYVSEEVLVSEDSSMLSIELEEDVRTLSEVVVTGYRAVYKRDVTGSVSTVRSKGLRIRGAASIKETAPTSVATVDGNKSILPGLRAGTLTAGEINDFSKWKMWEDISANDLKEWQNLWQIKPAERYMVQLTSEGGYPIIDASIKLVNENGSNIWQAKSDNTGKAELWQHMFAGEPEEASHFVATINGKDYEIKKPTTFHKGVNVLNVKTEMHVSQEVDIAFVVDATSSMADEIEYLKVEMNDVIQKVKDTLPDCTFNLGSVFYKDRTDDYLVKKSDFSSDINKTIGFIRAQEASGGGDTPEAVDAALEAAINELSWSQHARCRILFLVLDAPPHQTNEVNKKIEVLIQKAAEKGIRIIPVTGSGTDKSTEYLMRSIALATNGTYVFLTDHSGIGNPHIKPTTDTYDVEILNNLLARVIIAYTKIIDKEIAIIPSGQDTITQKVFEQQDSIKTVSKSSRKINLDEKKEVFSWRFYPNPTNRWVTIELSEKVDELFVTDITGKILLRHIPNLEKIITLDLNGYSSGIYFIRFIAGKNKMAGRLILRI